MNYRESGMHDLKPKPCIIGCPVRIIYSTNIHSRDFLRNRKHQLCGKRNHFCDIELTGLMNKVIDIRHSLKKTVEVSMCNRYRLKRLCSLAILIVMQSVRFAL